jgi:hypothetical protein
VHLRYLRVWPAPCGTIAAAETVPSDGDLEERLATLFGAYEGLFHVDLSGPYLLDVNPRIHASLPVAAAAGVDLVPLYCDVLRGARREPVRGRPGLFFRWLEGDARSVLWNLRRRQIRPLPALRALAPRRGAVHSYGSLRDPGPAIARMRFAVRRIQAGRSA